jgi:hypothetical protein
MTKTIKYILFGIVILAILVVLGFIAFSEKAPGSLIAGLAGIWAAIKSNIFNTKSLTDKISDVESEHSAKRKEWSIQKDVYDNKLKSFQARLDYLDYRSARLSEQINDLDSEELMQLDKMKNMSREEKLRFFNLIMNP